MTAIKIDSKVTALVEAAVCDLADDMFDRLGASYVGTIEVKVVERTEPEALDDKDRSVKLRVARLELAAGPTRDYQDDVLELARLLHKERTKRGTLDEVLDPVAAEEAERRAPFVGAPAPERLALGPGDVVDAEIVDDDSDDGVELARCRICSCTDNDPCEHGCEWVEDPEHKGDLCSRCLCDNLDGNVAHVFSRDTQDYGAAYCKKCFDELNADPDSDSITSYVLAADLARDARLLEEPPDPAGEDLPDAHVSEHAEQARGAYAAWEEHGVTSEAISDLTVRVGGPYTLWLAPGVRTARGMCPVCRATVRVINGGRAAKHFVDGPLRGVCVGTGQPLLTREQVADGGA